MKLGFCDETLENDHLRIAEGQIKHLMILF